MLNEVLLFLKSHLNSHLNSGAGLEPGEVAEDKVVFVNGSEMDPITFKLGAVSVLLINIEQEKILRPADLYSSPVGNGISYTQPQIRLNLSVLFVARFAKYEDGLSYLSRIIQHFQNHRVFDHQNSPELHESLDQLIMELETMPLAQQNDLWNSLRTTYHPSVLYRVKMVVFRDQDSRPRTRSSEMEIQLPK